MLYGGHRTIRTLDIVHQARGLRHKNSGVIPEPPCWERGRPGPPGPPGSPFLEEDSCPLHLL
jgi:hypothetical protein